MLNPSELTASEKRTIDKLMQDVPVYKQRIAGKSLPMEKFAVRRAERYFQTGKLVLPAIELMYLWNLFKITAKKFSLADGIFKIIEKTIDGMENNPDDPLRKFEVDNKALLLLLKGACMRHMKSPLQAIEWVLKFSDSLILKLIILLKIISDASSAAYPSRSKSKRTTLSFHTPSLSSPSSTSTWATINKRFCVSKMPRKTTQDIRSSHDFTFVFIRHWLSSPQL